jgi:mRNA interferase RelE/StbE
MTRYQLDYEPKARKQLRAVRDVRLKAALKEALEGLITDPRPHGCLKMSGFKDHWRVRVRDWRIVYRIEDGRLVVLVVTVAPRGGVYR